MEEESFKETLINLKRQFRDNKRAIFKYVKGLHEEGKQNWLLWFWKSTLEYVGQNQNYKETALNSN